MDNYVLDDADQQTVDEGEAARFLLTHPMFLRAIEKVRSDCAEAILKSAPQDTEGRETAYHLSRALSAVTVELDALVAHAEVILTKVEQLTPDVHPEEDDDQG